jgi:Protein of unknown function (DUF3467)
VEGEAPQERQLNIHLEEKMSGGYANFANVSFSQYEFTLDFFRIEHEAEGTEVPGAFVQRINISHRFMSELIAAMQDAYSKWETREGIRNLPETPGD